MAMPRDLDARRYYRVARQRLEEAQLIATRLDLSAAAVYLAGYAVECVLKALLVVLTPRGRRDAAFMQPLSRADEPGASSGQPGAKGGSYTANLPAGVEKATKDDSDDIRKTFAGATNAAVTKNGFKTLVGWFVDADRNRMDQFLDSHKNYDDFNQRVDKIRADFKAKYGKDPDAEKIAFGQEFKDFVIVQGEITNPALLSNWPLPQPGNPDQPTANPANVPGNRPGDRNLEKGRGVAVCSYPAGHGMPELVVSLIHEWPDSWRIDVPDNVDGAKLYASLNKHLDEFASHKDQWPGDINDAYRALGHHVFAAIYDLDMSKTGGMGDERMGGERMGEGMEE